jgi:hypothetical protein
MALPALLAALVPMAGEILDRVIPDQAERDRVKAAFTSELLNYRGRELEAAASVVRAEAQGESWLQRNWRPLLMILFGAIIANNYVVAPYMQMLFAFSVTLEIPPAMWELLKLGVGGYIVGRSAE